MFSIKASTCTHHLRYSYAVPSLHASIHSEPPITDPKTPFCGSCEAFQALSTLLQETETELEKKRASTARFARRDFIAARNERNRVRALAYLDREVRERREDLASPTMGADGVPAFFGEMIGQARSKLLPQFRSCKRERHPRFVDQEAFRSENEYRDRGYFYRPGAQYEAGDFAAGTPEGFENTSSMAMAWEEYVKVEPVEPPNPRRLRSSKKVEGQGKYVLCVEGEVKEQKDVVMGNTEESEKAEQEGGEENDGGEQVAADVGTGKSDGIEEESEGVGQGKRPKLKLRLKRKLEKTDESKVAGEGLWIDRAAGSAGELGSGETHLESDEAERRNEDETTAQSETTEEVGNLAEAKTESKEEGTGAGDDGLGILPAVPLVG
jgi:hypothetical protein